MTSAHSRSAQKSPLIPRRRNGYIAYVVVLAFLAWALVSMDNVMLGVVMPALSPSLHLSLSTLEYLAGVFSFVTFAAPVIAGRLIDRFGRRANFQVSLVGTGIFGGLTALVAEEAPRRRRGVLMGFVQAGYPLGIPERLLPLPAGQRCRGPAGDRTPPELAAAVHPGTAPADDRDQRGLPVRTEQLGGARQPDPGRLARRLSAVEVADDGLLRARGRGTDRYNGAGRHPGHLGGARAAGRGRHGVRQEVPAPSDLEELAPSRLLAQSPAATDE